MSAAVKDYWGYLVKPDKSPTPLFEELLLGIAHYIRKHVAPWEVRAITPPKLAAFYRLVGGNYDSLFLNSPDHSIAFVYKSLGCFHSLEPNRDPFAAPSVPALTPEGYVRWQTVQLLLEPELHVPFLQEAVKRFEIVNPLDGETFPRTLPAEALPKRPDLEMCTWEAGVREKLRANAELPTPRGASHVSRPSDVESLPESQSSIDDHSIVDAADYFAPLPRKSYTYGSPVSPGAQANAQSRRGSVADDSAYGVRFAGQASESDRQRNDPTPTHRQPHAAPTSNPGHRGRLPSISTESSFATTNSSRSPSPPRRPSHRRKASQSQSPGRYAQAPARPSYDPHGRRHSEHGTYPIRGAEPIPLMPQQPTSKRDTLSPHFFATPQQPQQNSWPTGQTGPSMPPGPPGPTIPPPSGYMVGTGPIPINTMQPVPAPALSGAFARGGMRASVGHAHRGGWQGPQEWHVRHVPPNTVQPAAPNGKPDPNGVRFAEGELSPRSERMRRRTMEEMALERQRDELNFEKSRRRSRHGSSETRSRPRGDKYL